MHCPAQRRWPARTGRHVAARAGARGLARSLGLACTGTGQHGDQFAQASGAVLDSAPADLPAPGIHNRHGVIIPGPVDPSGHAAGRYFGKGIPGRLQACLLAARPSGEAPSCGAGTRLPVRSLFGARRRSALSTVGTTRVTARPRRTHGGRQERQASRAVAWRHLGCISSLTAHRHRDGAPVSDTAPDRNQPPAQPPQQKVEGDGRRQVHLLRPGLGREPGDGCRDRECDGSCCGWRGEEASAALSAGTTGRMAVSRAGSTPSHPRRISRRPGQI